jgi:hypothetical protein
MLTAEFAPVITTVLTEQCTTEAEKRTSFLGKKTRPGMLDLLIILEFFRTDVCSVTVHFRHQENGCLRSGGD